MPHCSYAQEPRALADAAEDMVDDLIEEIGARKFALVYCGMSGVALATAMALKMQDMLDQFRMLYVRKKREDSHGTDVERPMDWEEFNKQNDVVIVFVDDFQETGRTRCYVMRRLLEQKMVTEDTPTFSLFSGFSSGNGAYACMSRDVEDNLDWTTVGKFKDHWTERA